MRSFGWLPVTVIVNDDLTLEKFKDHRIVEGDEVRWLGEYRMCGAIV